VFQLKPGPLQCFWNCNHWSHSHYLRRHTTNCVGNKTCKRLSSKFIRSLSLHNNHRTSSIGCLTRVSSSHAATRMKDRTKFCQCFGSGVCPWSFVDLENNAPCFDSTAVRNFVQFYIKRNDTVILQTSRLLRFERLLVASI